MRLQISRTKNAASYYVVKSIRVNGHSTSKVVEKLGTEKELREKLNGQDPVEWAKAYVEELNRKEKEDTRTVIVKYSPAAQVEKDKQVSFNGGYLFLQKIYYELGLDKICKAISAQYKFEYDLNDILSRLLYSRILFPASKLATNELSKNFIEQPKFELPHIYRSLDVLEKEMDFIQSEVYKNSKKAYDRNSKVLYYDCSNFFFEIEQECGLKQYGKSKENRPTPIVQMGLFMDGDGTPLAFNITEGNKNEQVTLRPTEKQIMEDFDMSKFVVCTDAGLASSANRKFNNKGDRAFITTQSIKKLKSHLKEWALDPKGWHLEGEVDTFDISELISMEISDDPKKAKQQEKFFNAYKDKTFYKERWVKDMDPEQRLIVTFSLKYKSYQREIRNAQIKRAAKLITTPSKLKKKGQNDVKRFILTTTTTEDGEVTERTKYEIDEDVIRKEEMFDGFYGVCTNLEDDVPHIISINHRRWQIEECFRIMKSEFEARPVHLQKDNRIIAHFLTCFLSLIIFRYVEKKLKTEDADGKETNPFSCTEIIDGLRAMNFLEVSGEGYIPTYTRNDFTDALHDAYGFRTDYQIVSQKNMKNIIKSTKK